MKQVLLRDINVPQSTVYRGMPQYPGKLIERLGDQAPPALRIAGSLELVAAVDSGQLASLALAVSVESPDSVVDVALGMVRELAEDRVVWVGGFHSPVERRCLDVVTVFKGTAVVCLPRALTDLKISKAWQVPLQEGRLVLVSASGRTQKRATRESVRIRNQSVLAWADSLLILHATTGGKTEALCRTAIEAGKPVWTIDHPSCRNLVAMGARPAIPGMAVQILTSGKRRLAASSNPQE